MINMSAGATKMVLKNVHVKASAASYIIFVLPAILMMIVLATANYLQGLFPGTAVLAFGVLAGVIAAVILVNRITLANGIIWFFGTHRVVKLPISEISIRVAFRSSTDPGYRLARRVGYYLEVRKRDTGSVLIRKNIKMYDRCELNKLFQSLRKAGVPVEIDQAAKKIFGTAI